MRDLTGHTIGALDVLEKAVQNSYVCKCRTCEQKCLLNRSYLNSDRALIGCRSCSRTKNYTRRGGLSKHPKYSQWHYMRKQWQKGEIDMKHEWTLNVNGFQNFLIDTEQNNAAQ